MANMSTFSEKPSRQMWTNEPQIEGPLANYTIPGSGSITFYDGQALGRDVNGTIVQMDDTAAAEFIGFETDLIAASETVQSTSSLGDFKAHIHRPYSFIALIASTAAGDEGRKVYWKYNNQVSNGTEGLTHWNYAGRILGVIDSTHVLVLAPWMRWPSDGYSNAKVLATGTSGTYTLTKFDVGALVNLAYTSAAAVDLPLSTTLSPGDRFDFIVTAASAGAATLTPTSPDVINGASTKALATTQYTAARIVTDGNGNWYLL